MIQDILTQSFYYALLFASIAASYSLVMTEGGKILAPFKSWMQRITHRREIYLNENHSDVNYEDREQIKTPGRFDIPMVYEMLVNCTACVSGQMTLWGMFYFEYHRLTVVHLVSVFFAVLIGKIYNILYNKYASRT